MKRRSGSGRKIVIGVTGTFGSGKTTVARILQSYGAYVIDADKITHRLLKTDAAVYKKVVANFGKAVLNRNKTINRAKLGAVVFGNAALLRKINSIVHPEVIRRIRQSVKTSPRRVVVLDAPLLIEAGLASFVDALIVVTVDKKTQRARLLQKARLTRHEILKRLSVQMSLKEKVRLADFVIDNSGTRAETRKQVEKIRRLLWRN